MKVVLPGFTEWQCHVTRLFLYRSRNTVNTDDCLAAAQLVNSRFECNITMYHATSRQHSENDMTYIISQRRQHLPSEQSKNRTEGRSRFGRRCVRVLSVTEGFDARLQQQRSRMPVGLHVLRSQPPAVLFIDMTFRASRHVK